VASLRPAAATWRALGRGCDLAEARLLIGLALRDLSDDEGAEVELRAAQRSFGELGAHADAARVADHLEIPAARRKGLTDRECEVLRLVAEGRTNRQIAEELVLSEHTIARHLSNIFTKLGVHSRTAAAAFAFEHELL
jgi:DNA-binding NarL/FixJ family response regulator